MGMEIIGSVLRVCSPMTDHHFPIRDSVCNDNEL